MYVVKRDGRRESVFFDKITSRVRRLCYGLSPLVDPWQVAQKVSKLGRRYLPRHQFQLLMCTR